MPCIPDNDLFQHSEEKDPWKKCYSAREAWNKLDNPVSTVPGHHIGLKHLRGLAKHGFATAIPYNAPTIFKNKFKAAHQLLAGGLVIYANPRSRKKNVAGVVFHPGNSTLTAHVRGEANPHLGFGRKHGHNKLWEWKFVSRIDPTAMAETIAMDELPIWFDPKLVELRCSISKALDRVVQGKTIILPPTIIKDLTCYINNIFDADFLDQFFQKANYKHRMLCGGADIALGTDGKWRIIEFNLGAESFGLKFGTLWNCYISNFLGRNTDLITTFESIFAAPLNEQQKFLSKLELSVLNHPQIDDMPEVYMWFRDKYCELFSTHPTEKERDLILEKLTNIFSVVSSRYQDYARDYIESARRYMNRELNKKEKELDTEQSPRKGCR